MQTEGLKSEALKEALKDALGGRTARLEDLFARHGSGPNPRPNLKLAAAFGDEMAALDGERGGAARLLTRLAAEDAAPDTPQVFSPMAAAFGWVGRARAGLDVDAAWAALFELAADERPPVRAATHAALLAFALARQGGSQIVARAEEWLDAEDRELRYGAAALVLEVLGDRQALATAKPEALRAYLSRAIDEASTAPRSAERSDGRRRLLAALPRALATACAAGADAAASWLEAECAAARQREVRTALNEATKRVGAATPLVATQLRTALEGSAKPPRDPSRIRPGVGRGRATRDTK